MASGLGLTSTLFGGLGGSGTAIGTAVVRLYLDKANFDSGLASAHSSLQRVGSGMQRIGTGLTKGVTLPIVAAGGVAVKFALDYENAFTRIAAVTNTSQEQVSQWKEQVLGLAGRTAQAPEELAQALYFLASAGLDANQIMPTLEASAKASAAGLGETADIARLTANALNAYSKSGLEASQVTDILVAAIREGTAEPDEFADAMGRILPIASKAGVSFDQVAASLAGVSNIGLDVNEGVTAMRGVLQTLLAPTEKAKDQLKDLGITTDELRLSLEQDGLIATLRMLEDATQGDIDKMNAIIGNVRALTGAFGLTTQEAEKVDAIFRRVADSTGSLDTAFEKTKQGPMFAFEQALARLKVVAIQVGQDLLPVVVDVVEQIGKWVKAFQKLSPETRETIIKVALLAAALGPLLVAFGGVIRIVGPLIGVFGRLGATMATRLVPAVGAVQLALPGIAGSAGAASTGLAGMSAAPIVAGLAIVAGGLLAIKHAGDVAEARIDGLVDSLRTGATSFSEVADAADDAAGRIEAASEAGLMAPAARGAGGGAQVALDQQREAMERYREELVNATRALGLSTRNQEFWMDAVEDSREVTKRQAITLARNIDVLADLGGGLSESERMFIHNYLAVGDFDAALKVVTDKLDRLTERLQRRHELHISTRSAQAAMQSFLNAYDGRTVTVGVALSGPGADYVLRGGGMGGIDNDLIREGE